MIEKNLSTKHVHGVDYMLDFPEGLHGPQFITIRRGKYSGLSFWVRESAVIHNPSSAADFTLKYEIVTLGSETSVNELDEADMKQFIAEVAYSAVVAVADSFNRKHNVIY